MVDGVVCRLDQLAVDVEGWRSCNALRACDGNVKIDLFGDARIRQFLFKLLFFESELTCIPEEDLGAIVGRGL